jgi:hypothetical protein
LKNDSAAGRTASTLPFHVPDLDLMEQLRNRQLVAFQTSSFRPMSGRRSVRARSCLHRAWNDGVDPSARPARINSRPLTKGMSHLTTAKGESAPAVRNNSTKRPLPTYLSITIFARSLGRSTSADVPQQLAGQWGELIDDLTLPSAADDRERLVTAEAASLPPQRIIEVALTRVIMRILVVFRVHQAAPPAPFSSTWSSPERCILLLLQTSDRTSLQVMDSVSTVMSSVGR